MHLTGYRVVQSWPSAPVGNMGNKGAGQALEQLRLQVAYAARSGRGIGVLARVALNFLEKALVVLGREARMHRDDVGCRSDVDDGCEVGQDVVGHLGIDGRIGRRGRDGGHAQGVTIRRRFGGFVGTHHAPATGAVFDHHALAQRLAQRL